MRAPRSSWVQTPDTKTPPATLLDWLTQRFPRIDRQTWSQRLQRGLVTDESGTPFALDAPFASRMRVRYFREVVDEPIDPRTIPLLHRDDHLVVADKPPFIPVTPSGPYVRRCLLYRLVEQLGLPELTPIHRLDRATSGVVLFAIDPKGAAPYSKLFSSGRLERGYEALASCPQRPREDHWQVASRLVAGDPFFRMRTVGGHPNARTTIDLIDWQSGVGHFDLKPATGKQHQLRIHLGELGWPIIGDRYYPDLQPETPDDPNCPLRLVARSLSFEDPVTGGERRFVSGWTLDLESSLLVEKGQGARIEDRIPPPV